MAATISLIPFLGSLTGYCSGLRATYVHHHSRGRLRWFHSHGDTRCWHCRPGSQWRQAVTWHRSIRSIQQVHGRRRPSDCKATTGSRGAGRDPGPVCLLYEDQQHRTPPTSDRCYVSTSRSRPVEMSARSVSLPDAKWFNHSSLNYMMCIWI